MKKQTGIGIISPYLPPVSLVSLYLPPGGKGFAIKPQCFGVARTMASSGPKLPTKTTAPRLLIEAGR